MQEAAYNERVSLALLPAFLRRLIRISLLLLHLVLGVTLAGVAFPLLRQAQRDRIIMRWSQGLLKVLGVRVRIPVPPDLPNGALLVCNHVSWLDIYVI